MRARAGSCRSAATAPHVLEGRALSSPMQIAAKEPKLRDRHISCPGVEAGGRRALTAQGLGSFRRSGDPSTTNTTSSRPSSAALMRPSSPSSVDKHLLVAVHRNDQGETRCGLGGWRWRRSVSRLSPFVHSWPSWCHTGTFCCPRTPPSHPGRRTPLTLLGPFVREHRRSNGSRARSCVPLTRACRRSVSPSITHRTAMATEVH